MQFLAEIAFAHLELMRLACDSEEFWREKKVVIGNDFYMAHAFSFQIFFLLIFFFSNQSKDMIFSFPWFTIASMKIILVFLIKLRKHKYFPLIKKDKCLAYIL